MTTGDAIISFASVGVLAQIGDVATGIEAWLKLGMTGILLFAVWRMWMREEQREKAEREEQERRDKIEQEREKALIDLIKSITDKKQ